MIIFLYGQDSYGLIQYVNQLVDRYRKKYPDSFNLHKFDLETDDQDEIKNAIRENSFFKQVKFIIVKNPFAKESFMEKLIKESDFTKNKDSVLLLYQTGEQEKFKDSKLYNLLAKNSQIKESKPPTAQTAAKFASTLLAEQKISMKKETLTKLTKETGQDLWRLKNELDKIISFTREKKMKEISEEDLAKLMSFKTDQNIFNIVDAMFSNHAKALILIENYFDSSGDPLYLLSMIAFQLKNMLIVREMIDKNLQYGQMVKKSGMHPFLFKKNYEAAKKYDLEKLKAIFQKATNLEIALKSGRAEAKNIFFHLFA